MGRSVAGQLEEADRASRGRPPAGPHARQPEPAHRCASVVRRDASEPTRLTKRSRCSKNAWPQPRCRYPRRTRRAATSRVARGAPCSPPRTRPSHRGVTRGVVRAHDSGQLVMLAFVLSCGVNVAVDIDAPELRGHARRCHHRRVSDLLSARPTVKQPSTTPKPNSAPIATTRRTPTGIAMSYDRIVEYTLAELDPTLRREEATDGHIASVATGERGTASTGAKRALKNESLRRPPRTPDGA